MTKKPVYFQWKEKYLRETMKQRKDASLIGNVTCFMGRILTDKVYRICFMVIVVGICYFFISILEILMKCHRVILL